MHLSFYNKNILSLQFTNFSFSLHVYNNSHLILFTIYFYLQMNIFIAGLSYQVNDADLSTIFEEYGTVSTAKVIMDRQTNRSKGYGFVEMEDHESALKAISELNGADYDGRTIAVSEARPREERPARNFNRGGGYGNRY